MATNQGSRAGLITSVVILSITSVVAIIFAFWYGAEKRKTDEQLVDLKKKYTNVISDAALLGVDMKELEQVRQDATSGYTAQTKLWDVAIGQRNKLARIVTGKEVNADATAQQAIKSAEEALTKAAESVKSANTRLPSTSDDMIGAVTVLADRAKAQAETIADRDNKLQDAEKRALDAIRQKETDLAARDEQIKAIRAEADDAIKASTDDRGRQQATVAEIEKTIEDERQTQAMAQSKKDVELTTKSTEVKRLEDRLRTTQQKFDRIRVGVTDPITRNVDGAISGFSGKDIVYINLGMGKQILPGLTFEVYDKSHGLPKIKDPLDDDQPAGKATIEVIRVLDNTSECRVVRRDAGVQIMQGDPILNIVFDPNIQYAFLVYGNYDLDRNGVATKSDADVIKRIVTQWGGRLTDKVGIDADFLVIGSEPVVPAFTADELADPVNIKKQEDAKVALAAYQDTIKEARELHIPILNQNRFLTFAGQATAITR